MNRGLTGSGTAWCPPCWTHHSPETGSLGKNKESERWHSRPWHQETALMPPTPKNSPTLHTKLLLLQHFSGKSTALGPGHLPTASLLGQHAPQLSEGDHRELRLGASEVPPKETVLQKSVRANLLQLTMWHARTKAAPSQCSAPGLVTQSVHCSAAVLSS